MPYLSPADWALIAAAVRKAAESTLSRSEHAALLALLERLAPTQAAKA